jgi:hypothetical protein
MKSGERKKTNQAMRYYDALALIAKLPSEPMQKIAKTMLLTGMSAGEYLDFEVLPDRIRINGGKNDLRKRDVPKLIEIEKVPFSYYLPGTGTVTNDVEGEPVSYVAFNEAVMAASNNEHSSNTFRHSYQLYLRKAGLDTYRQFQYAGHKPPIAEQIQERYTRTEETSFLMDDTEMLLKYLKAEQKKPVEKKKKLVLLD